MVALMSNPPLVGDASYATYDAERQGILQSLKRRAVKLVAAYNALEGVSCVRDTRLGGVTRVVFEWVLTYGLFGCVRSSC